MMLKGIGINRREASQIPLAFVAASGRPFVWTERLGGASREAVSTDDCDSHVGSGGRLVAETAITTGQIDVLRHRSV